MKIGLDIIDLDDFTKAIQNGGQSFLKQNFSEQELDPVFNIQSIAGKFAAKEAIFKCGFTDKFTPKDFQIISNDDGSPSIMDKDGVIISELSISISHTKTTAAAVVIWNS